MKDANININGINKQTKDLLILIKYIINETSDPHYLAIRVVALVPIFLDRGTIIRALACESVTTPGHAPNLK
jgi:hypothetical protein